jgi:metal-responsive CopG/Arc/MetJ family transcriptional regulator
MNNRKFIGVSFYLPKELVQLVDEVRKARADPTRSDTVRVLILERLAQLSLLSPQTKKALGVGVGKNEK